jgi:excisionase family DNA binding protein
MMDEKDENERMRKNLRARYKGRIFPSPLPQYITVREVADLLGVSKRSVYGYLEMGKLQGMRVGNLLVVDAEQVRGFTRATTGRPRTREPQWHQSIAENTQYVTTIEVQTRQGQQARLVRKLEEIRKQRKHLFPGTVARYVIDKQDGIEIILVWRKVVMPPAEERAAALDLLRGDLAEVLEWESAVICEQEVIMHT